MIRRLLRKRRQPEWCLCDVCLSLMRINGYGMCDLCLDAVDHPDPEVLYKRMAPRFPSR